MCCRNKVFANPRGSVTSGIDLASLSMKRCRDVGIRDFNSVRVDYGLPAISSWEELVKNDPDTVEKLKLLYPDVNDADLYVGGLAEGRFYQFDCLCTNDVLCRAYRCVHARCFIQTNLGNRHEGYSGC